MKNKKNNGFTLIELVIVIVIIGILSAVIIPTLTGYINKAKLSRDLQEVKNMNTVLTSLELFDNDCDFFDVIDELKESGYDLEKMKPSTKNCVYTWEKESNQILVVNEKNSSIQLNLKDINDDNLNPCKNWHILTDDESVAEKYNDKCNVFLYTKNIDSNLQDNTLLEVVHNINLAIDQNKLDKSLSVYESIEIANNIGYSIEDLEMPSNNKNVYYDLDSNKFFITNNNNIRLYDNTIPINIENDKIVSFNNKEEIANLYVQSYVDYTIKNNKKDSNNNKIDIILFAGQSNMCGRATIDDIGFNEYVESVSIDRAFTFNNGSSTIPTEIIEPLSINGTSNYGMIPSFLNEYYETTGHRVCACFMSSGGQSLNKFTKYTLDNDTGEYTTTKNNFYMNMVTRVNDCKNKLTLNGFEVGGVYMVWCQGENEGVYLGASPGKYTSNYESTITTEAQKIEYYSKYFNDMLNDLKNDAGIEKAFIVRIGQRKNDATKNIPIIKAQSLIGIENDNAILVSTSFAGMNKWKNEDDTTVNLMRDTSHYLPQGYYITGNQAGLNAGLYVLSKEKPILFEYATYYGDELKGESINSYIYSPENK